MNPLELEWKESESGRFVAQGIWFYYQCYSVPRYESVITPWDEKENYFLPIRSEWSNIEFARDACQRHANAVALAIDAQVRPLVDALEGMVNDEGIVWIHARPFLSKKRAQEALAAQKKDSK